MVEVDESYFGAYRVRSGHGAGRKSFCLVLHNCLFVRRDAKTLS
ncbi:hypothetical protein [Campylobacter troglodytis]|nr:hypothetical protein [Campylobacter troglodytis]